MRLVRLSLVAIPLLAGAPLMWGCNGTTSIVVNEVDWEEALRLCSGLSRPARACTFKKGETCTIIVPEGSPALFEHELSHCHDGAWHS